MDVQIEDKDKQGQPGIANGNYIKLELFPEKLEDCKEEIKKDLHLLCKVENDDFHHKSDILKLEQDYKRTKIVNFNLCRKKIKIEVNDDKSSICIKSDNHVDKEKSEKMVKDSENKLKNNFEITFSNYKSAGANEESNLTDNYEVLEEKEEEVYNCAHCKYSSNQKRLLIEHFRKHSQQLFRCADCSYTSPFKYTLKNHVLTHLKNKPKPFTCHLCNSAFTKRCNMQRHLKNHEEKKQAQHPFQCKFCTFSCTSNYILKNHISTHTKERPFKCTHCEYTTARKYSLKLHVRNHFRNPATTQYGSYFSLQTKNNHSTNTNSPLKDKFICSICDRTFPHNCRLQCHMSSHTKEWSLKCAHCGFGCNERTRLRYHIYLHTKEPVFKCLICAFATYSRQILQKHNEVHPGHSRYNCAHCDFGCHSYTTMANHIKSLHDGDTYQCAHCNYSSYKRCSLEKHLKSHKIT